MSKERQPTGPDEQLWETVIHRTECELLREDKIEIPDRATAIASQPQIMSAQDITAFIEVIAQSHKCDPADISYYYEAIFNDDQHVLLDEIFLVFNMKTLADGTLTDRAIHTIRVAVPQEVQQRAKAMLDKDAESAIVPMSAPATSPMPAPAPATMPATSPTPKKRTRKRAPAAKKI